MSVEPVRRSRTPSISLYRWRPRTVTLPAILLLSLVPLLAGADDLLPAAAAVTASVAISADVHGGLLIRLAWHLHTAAMPAGIYRGAGFTGLGALCAGAVLTGALLLDEHPAAADTSAAGLAAGGLLVSTLLYLIGLLLMPGVVPGGRARMRRLLDGAGLGVCFGYTAWLLVAPRQGTHTLAVGVALTCCTGVAIAAVTALGATRHRWAALSCAAGAALSMVGVAGVAVVLGSGGSPGRLLAVAVPVVLGPAVSHAAARHAATRPQLPGGSGTDDDLVGYPLLVVPVGGALAATAYHVTTGRPFDAVAIMLGVAAAATLAARETFALVDLRGLARRAARREAHFRSLIAGSMDVTLVLDDDLAVRWQSPAAARLFGLSDQDVMGRPFVALVPARWPACGRYRGDPAPCC